MNNERKLIDEIKLAVQQDAIAGYWNGRVFVSDDKKTYTNIISNSQPIGVGFIVKHGDKWLLVVGSSNSEGRKNIINSKRSRLKPTIDPQYPVITLFGNVIIANNNQILGIGGNQPKKQIKINNQLITVPFGENVFSSKTYVICNGYIVNLKQKKYAAFFDWAYGHPFSHPDNPNVTYISIINNIKTEIVADRFASYLGYGLWVWSNSLSLVIRNGVLTDYSASDSSVEFNVDSRLVYKDYTIVRNSWEGIFTFKRKVIEYEVNSSDIVTFARYKNTLDGYAPILNFEKHYIKQSISCEDEWYHLTDWNYHRPLSNTELSNSFSLVNKETSATQPLNSDDFFIAVFPRIVSAGGSVTYPTSKDPGTTFGFKFRFPTSFNPAFLANLPVIGVFYINDGHYFIKANITNTLITTTQTFKELTVTMTIVSHSKKLKSLPSFGQATVVSDNGSFHCFYIAMVLQNPKHHYNTSFSVLFDVFTKQTMNPIAYAPLAFSVRNVALATLGGHFNNNFLHFLASYFLKNLNFVNNRFYNVINFGKSVEIWKLETNGDIKFEKIIDDIEYYDAKGLPRGIRDSENNIISYPRFYSYSYYPINN